MQQKCTMRRPPTQYVTSCSSAGLHQLAYTDWGDAANPQVLICAHGLTRNKHDFDALAQQLSAHRRVICFDFPGRGDSDWLGNKAAYEYQQYVVDAMIMLARTGVTQVDWLGTSMGGVLGMLIASMPASPIRRLIINDVGPFIPKEALRRIADYVGEQPVFNTTAELNAYMRTTYASFGMLSDQQWDDYCQFGQRALENGQLTLNYDPDISVAFKETPLDDVNLWPVWASIHQPCLLIHGEDSDLLDRKTADKMHLTGPKADILRIPKTGHAPALANTADITAIQNWLNTANISTAL